MVIIIVLLAVVLVSCSDSPTEPGSPTPTTTPQLYFSVQSGSSTGSDVVRWNPETGTRQTVVPNAGISNSPRRGKMVVFNWDGDSSDVILCNTDGTSQRVLARVGDRVRYGGVSTDGSWIYFIAPGLVGADVAYQVWVQKVDEGVPELVAQQSAWENNAKWHPTDNKLVYIGRSGPGIDPIDTIVVYHADTKSRVALTTEYRAEPDGDDSFRWNRSGSAIIAPFIDLSGSIAVSSVVTYNAVTGERTELLPWGEWVPFYVVSGSSDNDVVFSAAKQADFPTIVPAILRLDVQTNQYVKVVDLPESHIAYYVNVHPNGKVASYSLVSLAGSGDPTVTNSPIYVVDLTSGSITDLSSIGTKAHWER